MSKGYTEDHLVGQAAIQLMEHELGWDSVNTYDVPSQPPTFRQGYAGREGDKGRGGPAVAEAAAGKLSW